MSYTAQQIVVLVTHRDVFLASWLILWHLDDKPVLLLSTVCLLRWIQPLSGTVTQSSLPQAVSEWTAPRHRCVVIALASLSSGIPHQGCVVPNTHPTWGHRGKELKWLWLYRPSPHILRLSVKCSFTVCLHTDPPSPSDGFQACKSSLPLRSLLCTDC